MIAAACAAPPAGGGGEAGFVDVPAAVTAGPRDPMRVFWSYHPADADAGDAPVAFVWNGGPGLATSGHLAVDGVGPLALDVDGAPARAVAPTFAAHLDAIDPLRRGADDLDPFAATHVRQVVLTDGDRVEVRGRLVPMPGAASGAAYRGVTSERWIPDGVPQLVRAS